MLTLVVFFGPVIEASESFILLKTNGRTVSRTMGSTLTFKLHTLTTATCLATDSPSQRDVATGLPAMETKKTMHLSQNLNIF